MNWRKRLSSAIWYASVMYFSFCTGCRFKIVLFFRKKRERDYEMLVTVTGKKLKLHWLKQQTACHSEPVSCCPSCHFNCQYSVFVCMCDCVSIYCACSSLVWSILCLSVLHCRMRLECLCCSLSSSLLILSLCYRKRKAHQNDTSSLMDFWSSLFFLFSVLLRLVYFQSPWGVRGSLLVLPVAWGCCFQISRSL